MAYSKTDFIWIPDETTAYDYTSNYATMASSVENTVGPYVYQAEATATPMDTSNFGPYTAGNQIRVTREGKMVTLSGTWQCKTAGYISGTTSRTFAQLPAGFRPKYRVPANAPGSGTSSWLLMVNTDGKVQASRADGTQNAGYWMPFCVTYLAED